MKRSLQFALLGILIWHTHAIAQIRDRFIPSVTNPVEGTGIDGGVATSSGAPLSELFFNPGRLTIEPQIVVAQINLDIPGKRELESLWIPALGVKALYAFHKRIAAFLTMYGTSLPSPIDNRIISGTVHVSELIGCLGAAFNLVGPDPQDTIHLAALAALGGLTIKGTLKNATVLGLSLSNRDLFTFKAMAAMMALQFEWRVWKYFSITPYMSGWRLLGTKQYVGQAKNELNISRPWQFSPGLDMWIYPSAESQSHISLGALLVVSSDKPVTTFTLGYTFSM